MSPIDTKKIRESMRNYDKDAQARRDLDDLCDEVDALRARAEKAEAQVAALRVPAALCDKACEETRIFFGRMVSVEPAEAMMIASSASH